MRAWMLLAIIIIGTVLLLFATGRIDSPSDAVTADGRYVGDTDRAPNFDVETGSRSIGNTSTAKAEPAAETESAERDDAGAEATPSAAAAP